jgi:hypothetical protein
MRHVLHLMQPARRAGRRRGSADGAVRVPRDRWVSRICDFYRRDPQSSLYVNSGFRPECANSGQF